MDAVRAVFAEFDPECRYSHTVNEQSASIRRVPGHRAEDVAATLVQIVNGQQGVDVNSVPA